MKARSDTPASPTHVRAFRCVVAQGWVCPLCGHPILREAKYGGSKGLTLEHVWPRAWGKLPDALYKGRFGLTLGAHGKCNSSRGHERPTGCELVWLEAVNARLGRNSPPLTVWRAAA